MEFGNPIVGGEDLIRESIKSPNFESDPENGVQGWQISRDGTATFYNLVIGSQDYTIDQNGNAVFASVSADQIILNGTDLSAYLDDFPKGIIALNNLSTSTGDYTGTAVKCGEIVIPNASSDRMYRLGYLAPFDGAGTTGGFYITTHVRYKWDATVAVTDPILMADIEHVSASTNDLVVAFEFPFQVTATGTDLHLAVYFLSNANGYNMTGSAYSKIWVEDIGLAIPEGTWTPTVPAVQTYTKTYAANGSASFQSNGTNRGVASCYQGYYSGTNGNQYSMITFPYATIQADLAGATITKTELYLNNNHFYSNSGGTAIIGYHNQSSVSGSHSSSQITDNVDTESFTYGQAKWFTVTNTIGNAFKNNTAKGIALGPGPSSSQSYYGYFAGNGESGEPQLRITYTK